MSATVKREPQESEPSLFDLPSRTTTAPPSTTSTMNNDTARTSETLHQDVTMVVGSAGMNANQVVGESAPNEAEAMQALSKHSHVLIKTIHELEALNIDATLTSLPKFVVVGDQSAGKSSIIEAICDISLPRSQGTCTRCPFQITTSSKASTQWSCKVSLHYKYARTPETTLEDGLHDYTGWTELLDSSTEHFAQLDSKADLAGVLRAAQLAMLNPGKPASDFALQSNIGSQTQVSFTPNVICLEISAAGLPELSLYDLPGAINVLDDAGEEHLVAFIEHLMKDYMHDGKALILLACPADQDIENSTAFRFVNECKAKQRCMGVFTKPDLLSPSQISNFRQVLSGKKFRLENSWFVTKHMTQEELEEGLSYEAGRQRELDFFKGKRWSSTASGGLGRFSHHFGTANLRNAISQKLCAHIKADLPQLHERVQARIHAIDEDLLTFSEKPQSAALIVLTEISELAAAVKRDVEGGGSQKSQTREVYDDLVLKLQATFRKTRPQPHLGTPGYVEPSYSVDSDDEAADSTPSKSRKGNDGARIPQQKTPRGSSRNDRNEAPKELKDLDKARLFFQTRRQGGFQAIADPRVDVDMARSFLSRWSEIMTRFMDQLGLRLQALLTAIVHDTLPSRQKTAFFRATSEAVKEYVASLLQEQTTRALHTVQCETHLPDTRRPDWAQLIEAEQAKMTHERTVHRVDEKYDPLEAKRMPGTPKKQDRAKRLDDLAAKLPVDEYAREIRALGTALAYYDVASTRLVDTITLQIEFGLMRELQNGLKARLAEVLRVHDEQHCLELLAEDPEREAQRFRLTVEKGKLGIAAEKLSALMEEVGAE